MENSTGRQESISCSSTETKEAPMEKPPIQTTESGIQYVKAIDVIRSQAGWAEIQRLKEADLIRQPVSTNGENSSSESK